MIPPAVKATTKLEFSIYCSIAYLLQTEHIFLKDNEISKKNTIQSTEAHLDIFA